MLDAAAVDLERERLEPRDQVVSDDRAGLLFADVHIMTALRLGGRREDRFGQPIRFAQSLRQRDAADGPALLILLPARTRQIPASDAFDLNRLGPADQHRAAPQLRRVLS